jgi:hypothetical protein
MNTPRDELEHAWQQAAERGDDTVPAVARYRRLYAALRRLETPVPPPMYARDLERHVRLHGARDDATALERWTLRIGLVVLAGLAVAGVAPLWSHWQARLLPPSWLALLAFAGLMAWAVAREPTVRAPKGPMP